MPLMLHRDALSLLDRHTEDVTTDGWRTENIGAVNSQQVFVRVMTDVEAPVHTHDESDEFFLVLNGSVEIDVDHETVRLNRGDALTVPAGTPHRARAQGRVELITILAMK